MDCPERSLRCSQPSFVPADRGSDKVEDLHDGRPERRNRMRRSPGNMVGNSTAMAIRDVRQRNR